jgi:ubiquinone/menaquinone biosynthesis C-methylase UbiE
MRRWWKWLPLAIPVLVVAVLGGIVAWAEYGPGLDREAEGLARLVDLRPGMTVAEIGAGKGRTAVRIARFLGPEGRLFASEIEAEKLEAIRDAAAAAGLSNVTVLEAGEHSTNLADQCCDVIYMRRVYHHLTDAGAVGRSLHSALRANGRLAVIDMLTPAWLIVLRHGIPSGEASGQLVSAGFALERRIDRWSPIDYCLVFRKQSQY